GLAGLRRGSESPEPAAGCGIVGADEAAFGAELRAPHQPLNYLAVDDERSTGIAVAFRRVGDLSLPDELAVAGVEGVEPGVGGRDEYLVLIDREAAGSAVSARDLRPEVVLPDQVAGSPVERLHDVAGVGEIDDAVMDDGGGLIGAAVVHGPDP